MSVPLPLCCGRAQAWYLSSKGRTKESLRLYDTLVREASMTEADKDRIKENIRILKQ
jgi:hypothetical protein